MKTRNFHSRASLTVTAFHHARWFAGLIAGAAVFGPGSASAANWNGNTSTNWNTITNWSGTVGTDNVVANINSIPANVATISADFLVTPTNISVGVSAAGRLNHVAGNAWVSAGNDLVLGRSGISANGTYNLADTDGAGGVFTNFGLGSGSMTIPDQIYVGGSVGAATGTLNMRTSGTLSVGSQLLIGNLGGTGTMNMDAGTLTVVADFEVGNGTNGTGTRSTGTFNMSGGTVNKTGASTAVTIGGGLSSDGITGDGGIGTANLNGGTFTTAGVFRIGQDTTAASATVSTGVVNLGGTALTVNGEFWVGNNTGANGTLNFTSGSLTTNNWTLVGRKENSDTGVGATGHVEMSGGTWTKNGETNFVVGDTGPGTMNMTGGTVIVNPHTTADRGVTWVGNRENANGTLTISGTAEFRSPQFVMGVIADTTGVLNLNGGTVRTGSIIGGSGESTVNFNGTAIIATASNDFFVDTLISANVGTGGLVVDSDGRNLVIPQTLTGVGGKIVKNGAGTLSLTGANSYTGGHTVNGGILKVRTNSPGTGDFTVSDGATLALVQAGSGGTLSVPNVTLGSSGAASLDLEISEAPGNPPSAPLQVTSTLGLNGPITVNVDDAEPAVGNLPLVSYTAPKAGGGSFVLGRLPLGAIGTLSDNGTGLVSLNISTVVYPRWEGNINGNWDSTTANWINPDTNSSMLYQNPLPVRFNDEATGTTTVVLNSTLSPGHVYFDNETKDYTLNGTGKITGYAGLTKSAAAKATVNTTNDYTGVTTIAGGVLSVGTLTNGGLPSGIGAASASDANLVLDGGTLEYTGPTLTIDRGLTLSGESSGIATVNQLTLTGQITSTVDGSFLKSGAGILTLKQPSLTLGGPFMVNSVGGGTLEFSGPGQSVVVPGDLHVGTVADVAGHLLIQNSNLTALGVLSVGRGNGETSTVSTITATGSVVQAGTFSSGADLGMANDSDQTVTLTNTQWTTNGFTLLAQNGGSTTNMTLAGNTVYTARDRIQMAISGTAVCNVTLQDTASLTHTGGWFSIGNDGTGSMTVKNSASVTTTNADFNISDVGTSNGTLNIQDTGTVSATGIVFVGKSDGTTGTVNMTGGTFNSATYVTIGRRTGATGFFNLSGGTMNQTGAGAGFIVGENGTGTLTVSGAGVLDINGGGLYLTAETVGTGNGTAFLNAGGTIIAKRVVERDFHAGNISTFHFNGGVLRAKAGAVTAFMTGLDTATIDAGGAFIDSNGQAITIAQALGGTGNLTKQGTGTLTMTGANTYTGNTTVAAGTLSLSTAYLTDSSTVTIASGAVLNLTHTATDDVASLFINNSPTSLPVGTYDAVSHPGIISGTGKIHVTGVTATPFQTWIANYPSIPAGDRDPEDDPDRDGATNAMEFALGGTPNSGSSGPIVYSLIADSSADGDATNELIMTIAVRAGGDGNGGNPVINGTPSPTGGQDGYTYTIQGSTTLSSYPVVVTPVDVVLPPGVPGTAPTGYEYRSFSLSGSNGTPGKGFLRVSVTP
jgi:autotransporter-associated beta strand protein